MTGINTLSKKTNTAYFIELKTDHESIRQSQVELMEAISQKPFIDHIKGIIMIYENSKRQYLKYAQKHSNLLQLLIKQGLVKIADNKYLPTKTDYTAEAIYILPKLMNLKNFSVITFQDIIDFLKTREEDSLSLRMIKSLKLWESPIMK
ncbi:MAG: hypothetical protein FJY07_07970 [Bacteroidetes bacterium]|nr:hypothetical protein [Bacteroidota bacterium]